MAHQFVDGVYFHPRRPRAAADATRSPAVFLDRDGCIIELGDYLHRPQDVRLIDGAAAAIAEWNRRGIPVVIVTNQSGIGRAYYDWDAFIETQAEVDRQLAAYGAHVDVVVACPFHADALPPYQHADHPARKPNPGMLQLAADWLRIDLRKSWMVGDSLSDMQLVESAGLASGIHLSTGYGPRDRTRVESWRSDATIRFANDWGDVLRQVRVSG